MAAATTADRAGAATQPPSGGQGKDDEVYVGANLVRLAAVAGCVRRFDAREFKEYAPDERPEVCRSARRGASRYVAGAAHAASRNFQLAAAARARSEPLAALGAAYASLVIPAIPATDVERVAASGAGDLADAKQMEAEGLGDLARPLLKVPQGQLEGWQSGVRSALLRPRGSTTLFRLKGCGNQYEGFPVRPVAVNPKLLTPRGSAFEHTALRELWMTHLVDEALATEGLLGANTPWGWFEYELPDTPLPLVRRTCVVMRTLGNRRLGDHLLIGLERLLPHLLRAEASSRVAAAFPASRRSGGSDADVSATWWAVLTEEAPADLYASLPREELREPPPFPSGPPQRWSARWRTDAEALHRHLLAAPAAPSLLAAAMWAIGRQCGAALRLMHAREISWGTYVDELGTHCNAHSNNFVVLPEAHAPQLVAPLDLDMAFTRRSFLRPEATWREWLALERNGLRMTLAGDPQVNSGVQLESPLPPAWAALRWALRDTLLCAFDAAYAGKPDEHPLSATLHAPMHALFRLALMHTSADDG
jgi:hypothetical protein